MNRIMKNDSISLNKLATKYQKWISSSPSKSSEIESTVKWVSLLLLNQFNNSSVLSELIFSLSNLLIFFNDRIILKSLPYSAVHKRYEDNLKIVLTILDHCEVFIEITARKLWGPRGKWVVVLLLQLFKSLGRIRLLCKYKIPLIECPPVPYLKRKELIEVYGEIDNKNNNDQKKAKVLLLNSGKIIRSINSDHDITNRSWKPVELHEISPNSDKQFDNYQLVAEAIYILKPLIHLGSMYYYGQKAWKPWTIALSLDLASIYFMTKTDYRNFSRRQNIELTRRSLFLCLYLIRSPFYDRKSKQKIERVLLTLTNSIPFTKFILNPLSEYLPLWQQIYFHTWSS